jgi:Tfp pilus assembly protein PilW
MMVEQNSVALLELMVTSLGLLGVGVTWFRTAKARGAYEQKTSSDIEALRAALEKLERTIGNGGLGGLKRDVQDMRVACAERMAKVETMVQGRKAL